MTGEDLTGMHYVGRHDVWAPDGTHLAESRGPEGGYRGSTLDDETNIISGQSLLFKADDDNEGGESEPTPEEILARIIIGGTFLAGGVVVTAAVLKAGEIRNWWDDTAAPKLKLKWRRHSGKEEVEDAGGDEDPVAAPIDFNERRARARKPGASDAKAS